MTSPVASPFAGVLDWLETEEINPEIWVLGLPIRLEELRHTDTPVDRELLVELIRRLTTIGGRALTLYQAGREIAAHCFAGDVGPWSEAHDPLSLFLSLSELRLDRVLPGISLSSTSPEPGVVLVQALGPGRADELAVLFEFAQGLLCELPRLIEAPPVLVECEPSIDFVRYRVLCFAAAPDAFPERATVAAPASSEWFAIMDARSLDELGRCVVDELCADFVHASVWVDPCLEDPDAAPVSGGGHRLLAMRGEPSKPPARSIPLALGDRVVGRIDLWEPDHPGVWAQHQERLESAAPIMALALEATILRGRSHAVALEAGVSRSSRGVEGAVGGDLVAEESRYRELVEHAADAICELGADGRILFISPGIREMLGHPESYFEGKHFLELLLPEEREAMLEGFQKVVLTGAGEAIRLRTTNAQGALRTLEATSRLVRGHDGEADRVVSILRDATERARESAELRESEARYRALAETSNLIFGIADEDGRVLAATPNAERTLGIPPSDDLARAVMAHLHPGDRAAVSRAWQTTCETGQPTRLDLRFQRPDGETLWFETSWRALGRDHGPKQISILMHEITARKGVELALKAVSAGLREHGSALEISLVEELGKALQLHAAIIAVPDAERPAHMRTLAAWLDGDHAESFSYPLASAPCVNVMAGEPCTYPAALQRLFPAFQEATGITADAYVGAPLLDADGEVLGVFSVLHDRALPAPELARSMVQIFAQRAAGELSRAKAITQRIDIEERYQAISESSRDIIVEISQQGMVEYVSPSVSEVLGYRLDESLDKELATVVHPDDRPAFEHALRMALHDEDTGEVLIRIQHREGDWRWLESTYRRLSSTTGEVRVVALCRDISQRIRAEQNREQLVSITQNSSDIILLASVTGGLRFLNATGHDALGLAREEDARRRTIFDFLGREDAERMRYQIMPAVHRNQRWQGEIQLRNPKTGSILPVEATLFLVDDPQADQPVAIAAICRDLSGMKQAEQRLRESEERYRMLAENPYDLISELDSEGRFVYVSPNFGDILEYSPEDLLGRDFFQLLPAEDREEVGRYFRKAVSSESTFHAPFRVRHRDGSYRWVDSTARAYRTAQGQVMSVLISRDVTERRRAEDALRQSEDRLRQAQKMEAIGRLAGGIAHDFNNLLTAIIGYCDLLLEELGTDHSGRDDAEEILKAAERAGGLTRQLLAFSRRQVLQPKVLELNGLVADIDRMLRRLIGEDIELRTVLEGELESVKADPGQLEQVILNLVVNARDAMPRGGRITLATSNEVITEADPSGPDPVPPGHWVKLEVADTGSGMDQATLSRIFDPFFTTKPPGEGTGLGLSTVIGIISQSGGHVGVESELGTGTAFSIYLPRVVEEDADDAGFEPVVELNGNETILVVEDASPVRKLVERYLVRQGYTVLEAATGVAALRHCQRHPGPIHLVLTDVVLPRMDGREIAERVQELRPDVKVIFMSGFTNDSLSKHGVLSDDVVLLEKPFTPTALLTTVRRVLDSD